MSAKFKVIHLSWETSVVLKCPVPDDKHPRRTSFTHACAGLTPLSFIDSDCILRRAVCLWRVTTS